MAPIDAIVEGLAGVVIVPRKDLREVRQITDKFYTVDRRKLTTIIPLVRRLREIHERIQ